MLQDITEYKVVTYVAGSHRVSRLRCATASREPSRLNARAVAAVSLLLLLQGTMKRTTTHKIQGQNWLDTIFNS